MPLQLNTLLLAELQQYAPQALSALEKIQYVEQTTSTNDDAKELAVQGFRSGLCLSQSQSSGRGQSARKWFSPMGNIYLSVLWTLDEPVNGRLALEIALAILNIPICLGCTALRVKWPNDLYHFDGTQLAKWGGILIEPVSSTQVVIGVGINLHTPQVQMISTDDMLHLKSMTSMQQFLTQPINFFSVAAQVVHAIMVACYKFDSGSLDLPKRFAAVDALFQKSITIQTPYQPEIHGVAQGVFSDGALKLYREDNQVISIYSGHIVY